MQPIRALPAGYEGEAVMRKNILVLALVSALANQAHSFDLKDSIYEEAGLRYNIDPTLLYAIALVESAVDSSELGMVNPYPRALRTDKPFTARPVARPRSNCGGF